MVPLSSLLIISLRAMLRFLYTYNIRGNSILPSLHYFVSEIIEVIYKEGGRLAIISAII